MGLITTGITTVEGINAAAELEKTGISVRHVHMPSIKPIDREAIAETARKTKILVTVENHTVNGGLGSAVAEVLCEEQPARLVRLGLQDHFGETEMCIRDRFRLVHAIATKPDILIQNVRFGLIA